METQKKKRKLKPGAIVLIALVLIGAGIGAYYLLNGSGTDDYAYVQTVAEIIEGNGGVVLSDRYSGIVEAKNKVKIRLEEDRTVDQCFVEVGDDVVEGTPLFSYDIDKLQMTSQQLLIDYETLLNNITSYNDEIRSLEKQLRKARASAKAELNVQLQTARLNVMKAEYDAKEKKKALDEAKAIIDDNIVRATSSGTVRSINPPSSDNTGEMMPSNNEDAYMVIVSNADFWVKGTISEQGAYQLSVGTPMTLRSRVDENKTWSGSIVKVNTEQPVEREGYYSDSAGENTSKYAFYVSLDSTEDLMMGQHLYIEFGSGSIGSGIRLLSSYFVEDNGAFYVYAADSNDRIEKRRVSVGNYDEDTDTYEVTAGLGASDRIAYPSDGIHTGMKAADPGYAAESPDGEPAGDAWQAEPEMMEEAGIMEEAEIAG
ncbi:MAG: efflux RND transporter periplasmic adaptor subunit [Clostridia bacterium]|nr:efflux RND transporter periplasmic adaptor subunit [Clostridia bacterium]